MFSNLKHQLKCCALVLILFSYQNIAFANIVNSSTLQSFEQAVLKADCDTLVIFDIDDVLLTAADKLFDH